MTTTSPLTLLEDSFQQLTTVLARLSADDWTREQNGKWTLAQETAHILKANQQTALLLSPAGRALWRSNTRPSLASEAIRDAYKTALAANPGVVNTATAPAEDAVQKTPAEQLAAWKETGEALSHHVAALSEEDLDGFTVWKHPLLGPLTAREMIYFTGHHTQHHAVSMLRKLGEVRL
ncbi:DinB family protein [Tellurirhabdus rosea]|uniref:DinB family protein n=1 Tax=Tellurirhabdus rosea TaxID=2674997 RepID=UPI0022515BC1|nr:DinB family protein [Tellurirhabdus rosea]